MLISRSLSMPFVPFEPKRLSLLAFFRLSNVGKVLEPCRITLVLDDAIKQKSLIKLNN